MIQNKRLRNAALLLVIVAMASGSCAKFKLKSKKPRLRKPEYLVKKQSNVMIPMSDGVRLAADVYSPVGLDQAPVILIRTPYGKGISGYDKTVNLLVRRGYIVVKQDVRGRFKSEGEFYPFIHDGPDGVETMNWIRERPWFDGRLGTYGGSYLGTTQWFSAPGQEIGAMHLAVTSPDLREVMYTGGELHLQTVYFWSVMMGGRRFNPLVAMKLQRLDHYAKTLPLDQADDKVGRDVEYFNQALDPAEIMKVYESVNFEDRYSQVSAPAVFVAGWYDMFLGPQLSDFRKIVSQGQGKARDSILIVGPWGHGKDGVMEYGKEARQKNALGPAHVLSWFDYHLKGIENDVPSWPRVRIFVMGENVWRDEKEWPLERTKYTDFYFRSDGHANTGEGDGLLSEEPPETQETPDVFIYDPLDPVPTYGGNNLGLNLGAYDQRKAEKRSDVLCYTTPMLSRDVEVTGPIKAVIYAKTSALDTDFTVKLVDVHPDGRPINIQDGVVRAMFRDNDPESPTPVTPGEIEEYEIDLWATSNLFMAGHKIRVEVSSSNFPRFNRNLNTGEPVPGATRAVEANQVIYHDPDHPSRIVLPIIPRR